RSRREWAASRAVRMPGRAHADGLPGSRAAAAGAGAARRRGAHGRDARTGADGRRPAPGRRRGRARRVGERERPGSHTGAGQSWRVRGARLDWRPLPIILQAGAVYHQRVCVRVAPGAFARLWDVIVHGRLACGECFAFEELDAAVRAEAADGTLLAAERLRLRPGVEDPTALGRLPGPNVVVGSLWLLAPGRPLGGCAEQVAAVLGGQAAARASSPQPHAPHERARCGVSELPNEAGLLVRALGPSAEAVERTLDLAAWLFPQS